jgi:hypothetical protein
METGDDYVDQYMGDEVTMVEEDEARDRLTYLRDQETEETVAYIHFRSEYCSKSKAALGQAERRLTRSVHGV